MQEVGFYFQICFTSNMFKHWGQSDSVLFSSAIKNNIVFSQNSGNRTIYEEQDRILVRSLLYFY